MGQKVKMTKQQVEFFEIFGENANKRYYFINKIYERVDNDGNFIEKELKELPEGIVKYINNKREK